MTQPVRSSLLDSVNAILSLNALFLGKTNEMEKDLTTEEQKILSDASTKLIQAGTKILEACK